MKSFEELQLMRPLLRALRAEQHHQPTPIQSEAIPALLSGRDLLACAQTGTGKTAAFALPTLQRLATAESKRPGPRALVLAPTRELAAQVGERFSTYGCFTDLEVGIIYGGVSEGPQIQALRRGVDIVVATTGRLLDLMNRGHVDLAAVEICILDEADRMLDMGFIRDIRRIAKALPKKRQSLLFSATMPSSIESLASSFLSSPVRINIAPTEKTATSVEQSLIHVEQENKRDTLLELLQAPGMKRAIVFTRTKHRANRLAKQLTETNIRTSAIHGNKSQNARRRALDSFKQGTINVLIATDVAARGIDIDDISHVVNYELPREAETYVHRVGRTGRAGRTGYAISLCSTDEKSHLRAIERLMGSPIAVHVGTKAAPQSDSPTVTRSRKKLATRHRRQTPQPGTNQPSQTRQSSREPRANRS